MPYHRPTSGNNAVTESVVLPPFQGRSMQKSEPRNNQNKIVAQVGAGLTTSNYKKNQNIFVQGEAADSVYFIQEGRIKATVTSEHGKEAVVGIFAKGQFFGEGCLAGHSLRAATMSALGDCRISLITKAAMIAALHDQPRFSELFMDHLLSRNSRIEEDVIDQLFNSSEKRLARLLLLLAQFRKGRQSAAYQSEYQPGNLGGDDRHHPIPRQFLHEQIPQTGTHQLQRKNRSP